VFTQEMEQESMDRCPFWSWLKWLITSAVPTACHRQLKCSSGEELSDVPCSASGKES